jgi:hypothetical protein
MSSIHSSISCIHGECKEDECMNMKKLGEIITKVPSKRQKESLFF